MRLDCDDDDDDTELESEEESSFRRTKVVVKCRFGWRSGMQVDRGDRQGREGSSLTLWTGRERLLGAARDTARRSREVDRVERARLGAIMIDGLGWSS